MIIINDHGDKSSQSLNNNNTGSSEVSKDYTLQQVCKNYSVCKKPLLPCHSTDKAYQLFGFRKWGLYWPHGTKKVTTKSANTQTQHQ
jgi:hypothetical protein